MSGTVYANQQDLLDRAGEDDLFIAGDRDGDDALDDAAIDAALADASARIDAWSTHCSKPWHADVLRGWTCEVAMYLLAPRLGAYTEQRKKRFDDIRDEILRMCPPPQGAAPVAPEDTATGSNVVQICAEDRKFHRRGGSVL